MLSARAKLIAFRICERLHRALSGSGLGSGGTQLWRQLHHAAPGRDTEEPEGFLQDASFGVDLESIVAGCPIATRKTALLLAACGEKNSVTSSSKNVRPVAPRR